MSHATLRPGARHALLVRLTSHDFDISILVKTSHRPWPMPGAPWVMTQTWHDLLFAHWAVDPEVIRARVPRAFELDLFDGRAWLGVVPFRMSNVSPRGIPSLPGVSAFPELNLRTYVRVADRPGVVFFSLDAASALAVKAARLLFNLPYYRATMTMADGGEGVVCQSSRAPGGVAEFDATYAPVGAPYTPVEGTLDYFLTERYCLYHVDRNGTPYRMEIHHPPWLLQPAEAVLRTNTMATAAGLHTVGEPAALHFARRQDMVAWLPSGLG